jgi:pimeloyl-ACP methyl ester carboxylesterase
VICPDTLGRGLSQWSPLPADEYCLAFYERLAVSLLDQLGIRRCHWLGTSMGGAIGLRAAAGRCAGASSAWCSTTSARAGRSRGGAHPQLCRHPPAFATMGELEQYFRTVYKPYGWLSDAQWRQLAETSMRRLPDGRVTPHYDPAMVQQFMHHPHDYDQWDAWDG